ncbi:MAG: HAD-IB family phosphatase [Erysipelotrichia bacterium]|nr:HAD-IB family phosphatase [Erysipelotrichia bacterium]
MEKILFLIDFDGTITDVDSTTTIGRTVIKDITEDLVIKLREGKVTIREYMGTIVSKANITKEQYKDILTSKVGIDKGFKKFIEKYDNFYIISSGFDVNILTLLEYNDIKVDPERIISNYVVFDGASSKMVLNKYNSENALDKERYVREFGEKYQTVVFIGDSYSDFKGAQAADYVFALKDKRLARHCDLHNVPYIPFENFDDLYIKVEELLNKLGY